MSGLPELEWRDVLRSDPCSYCGVVGRVEVDHIDPQRAEGSLDDPTNWAGVCRRCNASKGAQSVLRFMLGQPVGYTPYEWREVWLNILHGSQWIYCAAHRG